MKIKNIYIKDLNVCLIKKCRHRGFMFKIVTLRHHQLIKCEKIIYKLNRMGVNLGMAMVCVCYAVGAKRVFLQLNCCKNLYHQSQSENMK